VTFDVGRGRDDDAPKVAKLTRPKLGVAEPPIRRATSALSSIKLALKANASARLHPAKWHIARRIEFGTHRVPLETKYLEAYLQNNVEAVNCRKTPIECIVPGGIQTSDGTIHEADVIILAVGFDAGSGALSRIDIRGRDGHSLKDRWHQEIRTAMGLQVHGYPNLFTTGAPLAPSAALCNMTTCLQQQVDWITNCIAYARKNGKGVIEATKEFEDNWVKHHDETAAATLVVKTDSWYMGSNVDGKPRRLLSYIGGVGNYNHQCDELAANGYQGFAMN